MSQAADHDWNDERNDEGTVRPAATGNPVVDEVLASLDGLDARPTSEHVAVFESAHDRLRSALADAGDAGGQNWPAPSASGSDGA